MLQNFVCQVAHMVWLFESWVGIVIGSGISLVSKLNAIR